MNFVTQYNYNLMSINNKMNITFTVNILKNASLKCILFLFFIFFPKTCTAMHSSEIPELTDSVIKDYSLSNETNRKVVFMFVVNRMEELHFAICNEVFRRAGLVVKAVTLNMHLEDVVGVNNIMFYPNTGIYAARRYIPADIMIIPGGPGYIDLLEHEEVMYLLKEQREKRGWIGAIGHGLKLLKKYKIGEDSLICRPQDEELRKELHNDYLLYEKRKIAIDNKLITCCNTGNVMDFAIIVVEQLLGYETSWNISRDLRDGLPDDFLERYGL